MRASLKALASTSLILAATTVVLRAQPAPPSGMTATPAAPAPAAAPATNPPGPMIAFATPQYEFGKVVAGELVKHTFIFTNTGDQLLEVTGVQPQCGCTTAGEWTKKVEPGQTGTIPIQYNSANYPSGPVQKNVTVTSNAKNQPQLFLQLKGTIWKPIDASPQYAVISISPDAESAAATVHILNNTDEPITVSDPRSNQRMFSPELKTNVPGKDFSVVITALPPFPSGTVSGQVTVKTSSTNAQSISITAIANVQPAVLVLPTQLNLPQAPLTAALTNSFTIQNNSTNALQLSDPSVNAKGVDIQIKEMQPGRMFTAMVAFPQGFVLPPGQPTEITLKSSNPRSPVIKVPVNQPRPVTPPAAPPQASIKSIPPAPTSH